MLARVTAARRRGPRPAPPRPAPPQWSIPDGVEVSAECRDLLARTMVRDPEERITMAEIHTHPWFTANLPAEVGLARGAAAGRAGRAGGWGAGAGSHPSRLPF
jgi:serine/threonine protein kinase